MTFIESVPTEECTQSQLRAYANKNKIPNWKDKQGKEWRRGQASKAAFIEHFKEIGITSIEIEIEQESIRPPHQALNKEENMLELLDLSKEELAEVREAIANTSTPLTEFVKAGLLLKARKINSEFKKLRELSPEEIKRSNLTGSALSNLKQTTDAIVTWNHGCYDNALRVFINASILRNLTGSNLNTIKDFLSSYRTNDDHAESTENHNNRYKLTEKDNRKGRDEYGNRIKISELIRGSLPQKQGVEGIQIQQTQQTEEFKFMSPEEFASYVESLKGDEQAIAIACESMLNKLREKFAGEDGKVQKKKISSFSAEVTKYRNQIEGIKHTAVNVFTHTYGSPRQLKPEEKVSNAHVLTKDGKAIVSEPRHLALKYFKLSQEENAIKNPKK